jgi:hypothetical protein
VPVDNPFTDTGAEMMDRLEEIMTGPEPQLYDDGDGFYSYVAECLGRPLSLDEMQEAFTARLDEIEGNQKPVNYSRVYEIARATMYVRTLIGGLDDE